MNVTRRGQSDCETTCSLAQWLRPWAQHVVYRGQDIFHSLDNQVAIERPAVPSIWQLLLGKMKIYLLNIIPLLLRNGFHLVAHKVCKNAGYEFSVYMCIV